MSPGRPCRVLREESWFLKRKECPENSEFLNPETELGPQKTRPASHNAAFRKEADTRGGEAGWVLAMGLGQEAGSGHTCQDRCGGGRGCRRPGLEGTPFMLEKVPVVTPTTLLPCHRGHVSSLVSSRKAPRPRPRLSPHWQSTRHTRSVCSLHTCTLRIHMLCVHTRRTLCVHTRHTHTHTNTRARALTHT